MADRIIASGDARPIPTAAPLRPFLTQGESLCRLSRAPDIAALQFNNDAPDASLIALGIARAYGAGNIVEVVLEQSLPPHVQAALEEARDAADATRLVLEELQRRDGLQYEDDAR